jgi:hypothetical protein
LLAASGAYTPGTDGKSTSTASSSSSSGSSWLSFKGLWNLASGEVVTSNETTPQMRQEMETVSTATNSLTNAGQDFRNGNNDLGVQDLKTAQAAMDKDPNMSRQALDLDVDRWKTEAAGYIPFWGQRLQESFGMDAAKLATSTAHVGQDIGQSLGRATSTTS